MSNEYLKKLSDELRSARESKKISIDQIFTKTRIDKKYLMAIEDGNFSIMPEVYIRAFIREYSKTIGLDPAEILQKFDLAKEGKNYNFESEQTNQQEEKITKETVETKLADASKFDISPEVSESNYKSNKPLLYFVTAVGMLLTIFIVYKLFLTDQKTEIITERPFEEIVEEQSLEVNTSANEQSDKVKSDDKLTKIEPKSVEMIKPADDQAKSTAKVTKVEQISASGAKMVLTIIGDTKSWIRIVSDEINNSEFILDSGMTKILTAENKFYLHVGNSGGIKLLLNNKDLNFTGAPGKVRKIFVTENGIEYLRRTPATINAE
jgi:cytoskeletal protein RodZ